MKLNNVWNVIPKVLTYVRTHLKELLVPKIWFSLFFEYQKSKMEFLTIWKNWKMSRMSFWKFSPMCKSTSRRNPRSKNLIFVIFHLFSQKSKRTLGRWENVFRPYDEIESCRASKVESFDICKDPCWRAPRLKNLNFLFFIWRSVVDMFLVQTYLFPIWWSSVSLRKKSTSNKKAFFVDDKSHQEKGQQTEKAFFSLKISLTKKKDSFKQKKPLFVKDKFHQEKSQQTKKAFFR